MQKSAVFLFDVDNTLLDNDRVCADLQRYLEREVGHERQQRYWAIFEQLRAELGYADYLGALQHYRGTYPRDPHLLTVSQFLIDYPFANRLYPNSLDAVEYVKQFGLDDDFLEGVGVVLETASAEHPRIHRSSAGIRGQEAGVRCAEGYR